MDKKSIKQIVGKAIGSWKRDYAFEADQGLKYSVIFCDDTDTFEVRTTCANDDNVAWAQRPLRAVFCRLIEKGYVTFYRPSVYGTFEGHPDWCGVTADRWHSRGSAGETFRKADDAGNNAETV